MLRSPTCAEVLAEGIETLDQAAVAIGLGILMLQGFLYSRPVPLPLLHDVVAQFSQPPNDSEMSVPDPRASDFSESSERLQQPGP